MWHLLGDVLNFSTLVASFFVCVVRRKVNPVGGGCLGWGCAGSFGRKRHRLHSGLFAISSRETGVMSGGCVIRRVAGFRRSMRGSSLADEDLHVGLGREFIASAALVAVLARAAEALAALGQRPARLS